MESEQLSAGLVIQLQFRHWPASIERITGDRTKTKVFLGCQLSQQRLTFRKKDELECVFACVWPTTQGISKSLEDVNR